ncbi:MAG: class I SAM-dependent methyltransferase [Negativicutes bacterium]|nr:class I SAM-dependent methyltransferase [Negativicutes bacterium]
MRLTDLAKHLLRPLVAGAGILVDGTAGRGGDSLFLAGNSPPSAEVYIYDLQPEALAMTRQRLAARDLTDKCRLHLADHRQLAGQLPPAIDVAMFNLGYCPGLNKTVVTDPEATLAGLRAVLERLNPGGALSVIAYRGHLGGEQETAAVAGLFSQLPADQFDGFCTDVCGRGTSAPRLFVAVRRGGPVAG